MTWEEATQAMLDHFKFRMGVLEPDVKLEYPNVKPFQLDMGEEELARLHFVPGQSRFMSTRPFRQVNGRAVVNIFTPLGQGAGRPTELSRVVEQIWEQAYDLGLTGEIVLGEPEAIPQGKDPDAPVWRSGTTVSFLHYHHPA